MIFAGHQPHYLPYSGVVAKIANADVFVVADTVQFSHQEWQNRNRIRTQHGWRWLTIPVHAHGRPAVANVVPASGDWPRKHAAIVRNAYYRSPHLERLDGLWAIAERLSRIRLAPLCTALLRELLAILGVTTPLVMESSLRLTAAEIADPNTRIVSTCRRLGCDTYLSGSGGRNYLRPSFFAEHGITLMWQGFDPRPYQQVYPGWVPNLSVLDLVLSVSDPGAHLRSMAEAK
jgi:hypothetical protein